MLSFIPNIHGIAYVVKCITTLCVASRSGSCLIQHEKRPTGVRRPAHKGLEAASRQTEPGEKNADEPRAALVRSASKQTGSSEPSHLILNLSPSPQNLHRGEAIRPPGSVSRTTQASTGLQVMEQWNVTRGLCRPHHEQRTQIPLDHTC